MPDDLPADSGDIIDENAALIDIASTSKTTKRTASNNTKGNKEKKRKTVSKYKNAKWQKEPPAEGMKRIQFSGTPCVSNQVLSPEPLDIFELMFIDELVGLITQQTNVYFKQNIVGKIFKKHSRIQKHLSSASRKSELCTANDIRLFITSILYRSVNQKPVADMFYNRSAKIEPIHEYLVERWQSLLALEENISVDETLLLWKGRLSWKQFIKTKRAHFGLKSFAFAEASSGYV